MIKTTTKALVLAFVLSPLPGQAQMFDTGASAAKQSAPWKGLITKKGTMKLDFRNANVDMVLNLFQSKSGITIVKDPTLTQPITLSTAKPLSIDQAFEVLRIALDQRGFTMAKQGDFLVIKPKDGGGRQGGGGNNPFGTGGTFTMPQPNQTELRVYPLKFASSNAVAKLVNDVFNDAGGSNSPFGNFQFGGGGGAAQRIRQQLAQAMGGQKTAVRAASDDFSNSVIVNATSNDQRQISDFLKQIDKQNTAVVSSRVYKLQYAAASDVATVVNNVLQSNQPQGRGAGLTGQQQNQGGGFFANLFGRGNQSQVAADTRSNSVVVTTTDDIHSVVKQVIEELDKPIQLQNTTFVFPLGNARADQVANLLNQAFGSRQGSNVNFNSFNRNTTSGTNTNRNTNTTGNSRPAQLGGEKIDPNSLDLALADPSKDNGELLTSTSVSQGFFAQFGGGNQNRNQNNGQQAGGIGVGRDSQGKIINTRDLTGQVTIIPDINTNSIIVVANPDAVDLIKNILDQLDRTPEQVMIETIIVEASLSAEDKLGVEWNLTQAKAFGKNNVTGNLSSNFGLGGTASTLPGFKYTIAGGNLSALVNALATDSKFEILSTPRIFTSNNMQAVINVSQSVPYVVSQQTNTNGVTNFNYSFLDVGIVLTVTPRITANGMVTLDITQTANDLQGFTTFNAPIVNQREAQTTVSVLDGETAVLGGIMRTTVSSTVNKIPILGDIPILGNLFRSTDKTKQKTELLVFLSPHVVRTPEDARALTNVNKNEMTSASQKAVEEAIKLHNATNGEKPAEKKP